MRGRWRRVVVDDEKWVKVKVEADGVGEKEA